METLDLYWIVYNLIWIISGDMHIVQYMSISPALCEQAQAAGSCFIQQRHIPKFA
jgi:hypothetical protein